MEEPAGLQTLVHSQAPRFEDGLVTANGGFPLPSNFNGDFNAWYDQAETFVTGGGTLSAVCGKGPIPPLGIVPPDGFCSNPWPVLLALGARSDWSMTVYQASSGAWVFNAATNQWTWGLDDYFTGINNGDGADNGPAFRAFNAVMRGFIQAG